MKRRNNIVGNSITVTAGQQDGYTQYTQGRNQQPGKWVHVPREL